MLADARQHAGHGLGVEVAGTRHTLECHVIHIATGHSRHVLHALLGGRGGQQEDEVQPCGLDLCSEGFALFGRIVHHQHAINPSFFGGLNESAFALVLVKVLKRVGVAHQHHGRGGVALSKLAHGFKHLGQTDAARKRTLTGLLDHRAVGHGVGKRHAKFNDVGAAFGQRLHDAGRGVGMRFTRGDVRDKRFAALSFECAQHTLDAAHVCTWMVCSATAPFFNF